MTTLAGILGMPLQADLIGSAGGAAPPLGAFEALVAESVAADSWATLVPGPGAAGYEADQAPPTLPPEDRGSDALMAAVAAKALPGVTLPGVTLPELTRPEVTRPEVTLAGAGLPGRGVGDSSPLGMAEAPDPDAAEGREDDADETGPGWLLTVPLTPLMVSRDGSVMSAASSGEGLTQGPCREGQSGPATWITGSEMEALGAVAGSERAGTPEAVGPPVPGPHAADPGSRGPEAGVGEPLPGLRSGLDPAVRTGVTPPAVPAPPVATPAVAPPAPPVSVSPAQRVAAQEAASVEGRSPYAARAGQTTAHAGKPSERVVPQGAGADVPAPAAQTTPTPEYLGERDIPRTLPAVSAATVGRPAVEDPQAGEPAVRILDVPAGAGGAPEHSFGDGGGQGQREGRQATDHRSHAVIIQAPAVSGVTPQAVTPAVVAAPADAGPARLAEDVGEGVNQQIVQSLRTQLRGGIGEAVVRLKPEHLGEVTISVRVERGAVEATVTAALPAVREWLEAQEPVVRQHLAEQGLSLTRLRVQPDGSSPDGGRAAQQEREQAQRRRPRPQAEPSARFDVVV